MIVDDWMYHSCYVFVLVATCYFIQQQQQQQQQQSRFIWTDRNRWKIKNSNNNNNNVTMEISFFFMSQNFSYSVLLFQQIIWETQPPKAAKDYDIIPLPLSGKLLLLLSVFSYSSWMMIESYMMMSRQEIFFVKSTARRQTDSTNQATNNDKAIESLLYGCVCYIIKYSNFLHYYLVLGVLR